LQNEYKEWQNDAITLAKTGVPSWRQIAKLLKMPRSTVSDFLREYFKMKEEAANEEVVQSITTPKQEKGVTHLVIPDSQVRPGIKLDFLHWIGMYIVRKRPDVIVHLGDFGDMESLSSYDKGKRSAEGKRIQADIECTKEAIKILLAPLKALQAKQKAAGESVYNPRKIILYGNHEDRISRHVDANPEMYGFLNLESLGYEEAGWETVPFLTPIEIDGVNYCHYFPNVMTGKAMTGTAQNMLKTIGKSFTMGHRQTLDVTTRFLPTDGSQQWGLIAGAGYPHDEHYKGVQGNKHWRGIILKHNVRNGSYDPLFISLDWLEREYGGTND
jgi:hypothetical protein